MLNHRVFGQDPAAGDHTAAAERAQRLLTASEGLLIATPEDVPIEPLLFSSADYDAHTAVVKRMDALLQRVAWKIGGDPVGLRDALTKDPSRHELLSSDIAMERTWASCMFRMDTVLSAGVLKVLENNVGGAIGGPNLMHLLVGQYRQEVGGVSGRVHFDDALDARRLLYEDACRWMNGPFSIALLATKRETLWAHPRYWSVETDFMARHGIDAIFQEPEELASSSRRFTAALRHFIPAEWKEMGIDLGLVRRVAENGTLMLAPESARLVQNKRVLAWLSLESSTMGTQDREFITAHLPWTREIESGEVEFEGRAWNLVELVTRHRQDFVLKPVFGYGGHQVTVGRFTAHDEWVSAVSAAVAEGDFIVQQYVQPDTTGIAFYNRPTGKARRLEVAPVLGFAVIGGRNAGCLVRQSPYLTTGVVNATQGASITVAGWHVSAG